MARPGRPRGGLLRVLAAGLALTVGVLVADLAGAPLGPLRGAGAAVFGPVQEVVAGQGEDADRQAEVLQLRERVRQLEDEGSTSRAWEDLRSQTDVSLRPARVVGLERGGASGPQRVSIDAGRDQGVEVDQAVVAEGGLLGRVVAVHEGTAEVAVVGSPGADVAVRVGEDGVLGQLQGTSSVEPGRSPQVEHGVEELVVTTLARARVRAGDAVRTVGSPGGRPYPPGLLVGEIAEVSDRQGRLTDTAVLTPAVDLATVYVVGVVQGPPR